MVFKLGSKELKDYGHTLFSHLLDFSMVEMERGLSVSIDRFR